MTVSSDSEKYLRTINSQIPCIINLLRKNECKLLLITESLLNFEKKLIALHRKTLFDREVSFIAVHLIPTLRDIMNLDDR